MSFHHSKLIPMSFHHFYVIPKSSHHSNVIPSFWTHSHVIPSHLKLKYYGIWNFLKIHHSKLIPGRNDLRMRYFSFWGHSQMEWFGMTLVLIPSEWQGWPWNDWTGPRMTGCGEPPKRSFQFPSLSFLPHPVIPASFENAGTMGMALEWQWNDNSRGAKVDNFPLR